MGAWVLEVIVSVKDGRASKLWLRFGGAAPGAGEPHFVFPSNVFGGSRHGNSFDVRDKLSDDEREDVCASNFLAGWSGLEAERVAGDKSGVARCFPGCPVSLPRSGVGGGCMLGLTPETVLWST